MNLLKSFAAGLGLCVVLLGAAGCSSSPTRESTGGYVDSAVITGKVKAALASDDVTSLLNIEVETFRGVVQLSGFVDTEVQKDNAEAVAAAVDGVESVENALVVKPAG